MDPSAYFRRQCYVSFDADEWNLAASAQWLGADRILWASDYPHPTYSDRCLEKLLQALDPLTPEQRLQILGHNEVGAYGLPILATV
jgi:predicted TIM-barrel fold metal-dependent hydrolase